MRQHNLQHNNFHKKRITRCCAAASRKRSTVKQSNAKLRHRDCHSLSHDDQNVANGKDKRLHTPKRSIGLSRHSRSTFPLPGKARASDDSMTHHGVLVLGAGRRKQLHTAPSCRVARKSRERTKTAQSMPKMQTEVPRTQQHAEREQRVSD